MPKSDAPYPAEFRQQMIELARAGRNPAELAWNSHARRRPLGIGYGSA
jgi:hypothetical protein